MEDRREGGDNSVFEDGELSFVCFGFVEDCSDFVMVYGDVPLLIEI